MKKSAVLLCLSLSLGVHCLGQSSQKVLFIGNSYTYVNDLPTLLSGLALSAGDTLATEQNTPGGFTFQGHTTNPSTLNFLATPGFDFLILQEQSQRPAFSQGQVQQEVYPFATQLDTLFHNANPCGQTVFYMTWGRKFGDAGNCQFWPPVCTYAGMQGELRTSYLNMAQQNAAIVAPVGVAWWEAMLRDTIIELYNADQSHPALTGSYLAACVFYGTIYRRSPLGLSYHGGLNSTTATFLQHVADDVVFDSLTLWRIGLDDLTADFSHVSTNLTATFTDLSNNASSWSWDFGDGNTSTLQHPQHTYASPGTYTVTLTTTDGCDTLVSVHLVNVLTTALQSPDSGHLRISPNPSNGSLHLQGEIAKLGRMQMQLIDMEGRKVWEGNAYNTGTVFDLELGFSGIAKGLYVFRCTVGDWVFQQRLVLE